MRHSALKLYNDLAAWWPLLSAPEDYSEEAAFARVLLCENANGAVTTVLELGSGGGNNAVHMKKHFNMTLTDLSPSMLAVSRALNPECEHIVADMRTLRLQRQFDAVFVNDAVAYMITTEDLQRAIATAFEHCREGGCAVFMPDHVQETFKPATEHGGHDSDARALRYLEWTWDPDPNDTSYVVDFAYLLRERDGSVRAEHDRHLLGVFPRATWLRLLREAGFEATSLRDNWEREVFIGKKHERRAR